MVDYVKLSATALRLITSSGRSVSLVRKAQVAGDLTKPWDGPSGGTDILTPIEATFVPPNTVRQFGLTALGRGTEFDDLIAMSEQIAIVNPEALNLTQYTEIEEADTSRWGIIGLQILQPGDTQVLAFIGVRR